MAKPLKEVAEEENKPPQHSFTKKEVASAVLVKKFKNLNILIYFYRGYMNFSVFSLCLIQMSANLSDLLYGL